MLLQILRPSLQVFTDHATSFDYKVRARLLADLATLCGSDANVTREVTAASATLDVYSGNLPQMVMQRGTVTYGKSSAPAVSS